MQKDVRAVVLGLFVVVLVALAFAFWRGPSRDFRKLKGFQVEVKTTEGDETRSFTFPVPISLLAQLSRLARFDDKLDGDIRAAWDDSDITPRQILDAADAATPETPGTIEVDGKSVEVRTEGESIVIDVKDDWDQKVHVQIPRHLVEVFVDDEPLSTRELLRRLDELNPGDSVTIRDRDDEIIIRAEARKKIKIS
jgi:formylmethanofuran dehydrogenase subunit D